MLTQITDCAYTSNATDLNIENSDRRFISNICLISQKKTGPNADLAFIQFNTIMQSWDIFITGQFFLNKNPRNLLLQLLFNNSNKMRPGPGIEKALNCGEFKKYHFLSHFWKILKKNQLEVVRWLKKNHAKYCLIHN